MIFGLNYKSTPFLEIPLYKILLKNNPGNYVHIQSQLFTKYLHGKFLYISHLTI